MAQDVAPAITLDRVAPVSDTQEPMPSPPMELTRFCMIVLISASCGLLSGCWGDGNDELPKIGRASLIECGDKQLKIPPPPEMIRSDGIHGGWDNVLTESLPPEQKLLGYYTTFEDRLKIARQEPPAADRDCILHIREKDIDRNNSSWGLSSLEDDIDDEIDQVTKDLARQFSILLTAENDLEEGEKPEATSEGEAALLGWFGETDHSFGYSILTEVGKGEGATATTISIVTSTVVALVNGRMLSFQVNTLEGEEAGRAWAEKTASIWSQLAISANEEYEPPSWIWRGIKLLILGALVYGAIRGSRYLLQIKRQLEEEVKEDERREAARIDND